MPNRLARETSRYLLQHRDNPVDWYPWGEEALHRAREEDKPILLSIGYSACHWCHVMARESFGDPKVAAMMNEGFVCIKVDREERPDVDALYSHAAQAMNGRAGWPLNVFLTPDQVPFYAGTYFPPVALGGLPSWRRVLAAVTEAWTERRDRIEAGRDEMVALLAGAADDEPADQLADERDLDRAVRRLRESHDPVHGGFGGPPKFPPPSALELLLRRGAADDAVRTLRAMAAGGIHDQLGGGFCRYAVDAHWIVPHFEKMLYDNALLARAYLHGWLVTGEPDFRAVCCDTLDFALRELRGPAGPFSASLDAESESVEGGFYVWTLADLRDVLGERADAAAAWFGATQAGNVRGANVLVRAGSDPPADLPEIRRTLLDARERRPRPGRDEQALTSWNALMVAALAEAGATLGRDDYLRAATACTEALVDGHRTPGGRLTHTGADGPVTVLGYLDDHAFLVEALLVLYEATFDPRWFRAARELADTMIERFGDPEHGGFFDVADDHEPLLVRRKSLFDHPVPSGNSSAAYGLLRLGAFTGDGSYEERARTVLRLAGERAIEHPTSFAHLLQALDFQLAPVREVALVGDDLDALAGVVRRRFRPHVVLAGGPADDVPLLRDRGPVGGRPTAYVCERFACLRPVTEPAELERLLDYSRSG